MADENQIPEDVAAAIVESWPDGVVEEFDADESYFYDIHAAIERDLSKIHGVSLVWQTQGEPEVAEPDTDDGEPAPDSGWQSYHVFFLAPQGAEFEFETETEGYDETAEVEDPDKDPPTKTYPGRGSYGCAVAVSLATPVALIHLGEFAQFEDGTASVPDIDAYTYSEATGEQVSVDEFYQSSLDGSVFSRLQRLRGQIEAVMAKHNLMILEQSILDLEVPDLIPDEDIDPSAPLLVRDAFFFRGGVNG